jgi:hypothetical protein
MVYRNFVITPFVLVCICAHGHSSAPTAAGASIRGCVTNLFGEPLDGATIILSGDNNLPLFRVRTSSSGEYTFTGLAPGKYSIFFALGGFRQEHRTVSLSDGQQEILNLGLEVGDLGDLPTKIVKGVVLLPDQRGAPGANVILRNAFNERVTWRVKTNSRGHFKIRVSQPGRYLINAEKEGMVSDSTSVVLDGSISMQVKLALGPN